MQIRFFTKLRLGNNCYCFGITNYILSIYWDSQFLDLFFHRLNCGSSLSYASVCSTPLAEVSPTTLSLPNDLPIGPFELLERKPKKLEGWGELELSKTSRELSMFSFHSYLKMSFYFICKTTLSKYTLQICILF